MKIIDHEVLDLHRVYVTDDGGMGFDRGLIGHYTSLAAAEHAASLSRSAPHTGIRKVSAVRIGDAYYELKDPFPLEVDVPVEVHEANETRRRALAKLTDGEKLALGLA